MENSKTKRGFEISKFKDCNDNECSLQISSLATDYAIWFGINKPELTIFEDESMGKYIKTKLPKNWDISSRMHLTRDQIKELLPYLENFVKTGNLF